MVGGARWYLVSSVFLVSRGVNAPVDDLPYDPGSIPPPSGYPQPPSGYPDGMPQRYPAVEARPLGAPPLDRRGEQPLTLEPRGAEAPQMYDFRKPYGQTPQQ